MKPIKIIIFYIVIIAIAILATWFSQNSINTYWQQTYHTDSPLKYLDQYKLWQLGADLQDSFQSVVSLDRDHPSDVSPQTTSEFIAKESPVQTHVQSSVTSTDPTRSPIPGIQARDGVPKHDQVVTTSPITVKKSPNTYAQKSVVEASKPVASQPTSPQKQNTLKTSSNKNDDLIAKLAAKTTPSVQHQTDTNTRIARSNPSVNEDRNKTVNSPITSTDSRFSSSSKVNLQMGDKVFFAGDSLMQGVAPYMQRWLKQHHNIDSINLSKQSTGLSYPNFFDWPRTIEDIINSDRSIKLLVIFLGPNDPWDFPDPHKRGRYLKFQSNEWESVYLSRVDRILNVCRKNNVKVIWLGIPFMKKDKLNSQMTYLDKLLKDYLQSKVIWLPTKFLLSGNQPSYADSIKINGENVKMRSNDGIHFTPKAQKMIAEYIESYLQF
ncbi:DUF459 domain-containing protein [Basilea psittacipulmonis]|uniref:DUF459 domain-containing protein n=1 Tax=Basilea psittacipulmonis TaxID=1472345 RepID=UPI00068FE957|nr:DUF459 domain-containing protein [Basilea psittacipulmonis]